MELKDVKIGMRVVPHSKSAGWSLKLEDSIIYKEAKAKGQSFLYVRHIKTYEFFGISCELSVDLDSTRFDFFLSSDFNPYIEPAAEQKFDGEIKLGYFEVSYDPATKEIIIYNHVTGSFEQCRNLKGVLSHVSRELESVHETLPEDVNLH